MDLQHHACDRRGRPRIDRIPCTHHNSCRSPASFIYTCLGAPLGRAWNGHYARFDMGGPEMVNLRDRSRQKDSLRPTIDHTDQAHCQIYLWNQSGQRTGNHIFGTALGSGAQCGCWRGRWLCRLRYHTNGTGNNFPDSVRRSTKTHFRRLIQRCAIIWIFSSILSRCGVSPLDQTPPPSRPKIEEMG